VKVVCSGQPTATSPVGLTANPNQNSKMLEWGQAGIWHVQAHTAVDTHVNLVSLVQPTPTGHGTKLTQHIS
jgi:hypothetical protein